MAKSIYFNHPTQGRTSLKEIEADILNVEAKNNSASMDKLAFSCNTVKGLIEKIKELEDQINPSGSERAQIEEDMVLLTENSDDDKR